MIAICTPWTVVFRSWLMSLIITFMFEPAKLQMNCASASGSTSRPRGTSCWAAGAWVVAAAGGMATTRVWPDQAARPHPMRTTHRLRSP